MTDDLMAVVDAGEFGRLFVEHLGWGSPTQSSMTVSPDDTTTYTLVQVATYRGMGVWHCPVIPDLKTQRVIDGQVAAKNTERLIIYTDAARQEWRWPRYTRHRTSGRPSLVPHRHIVGQFNPNLRDRLAQISIPMGSDITVPELLQRMRDAFDVEAETASKQAARLMGALYSQLEAAGMGDKDASAFLARTLFLMFGDDTEMWKPHLFHDFLAEHTALDGSDLADRLSDVFRVANTPEDRRPQRVNTHLALLPYINGGIFEQRVTIPQLTAAFRKALIDACKFDWGQISPAVFGSMFQTVKDREARRHLGEHYTSETNILKVINPLFLDDLHERLDKAWDNKAELTKLHNALGNMVFLDPACGCGNFLIVAYRELRALELDILKRRRDLDLADGNAGRAQLSLDATLGLKVTVDQFHGFEIEPWPASIARTAMFLVDHQANMRMENDLGGAPRRLPITIAPHIDDTNALRADWAHVADSTKDLYVFGNPPFLGSLMLKDEQKDDARLVWGDNSRLGTMDYVTNWFVLAARLVRSRKCVAAFVSTNSITQGEQVAALWTELNKSGVKIAFAHRTFAWSNESPDQAGVHVVIIGLAATAPRRARLFTYESVSGSPHERDVASINPYLVPGDMLPIGTRTTPLNQGQVQMRFGSMPRDKGHLSKISAEEAAEIRRSDPIATQYLRKLIGAEELINGQERWCLWLVDATKSDLRRSPALRKRLKGVEEFRIASKAASTRRMASTPWLFGQIGQPTTKYIAVPRVSSETRPYVPMAVVTPDIIASDALLTIADPGAFTFGLLQSRVFSVWNATVSGRLESRYRISAEITYHNFPWPAATAEQRRTIEQSAQGVLDARKGFPGATLADLYNVETMPQQIRIAHEVLDAAVLQAYGLDSAADDTDVMQTLFARYQDLASSNTLINLLPPSGRRKRR